MNRVILSGRLLGRAHRAYLAGGVPIVHLRLQVPRQGRGDPAAARSDEIDCFAFSDVAAPLTVWAEQGVPVTLEGRLIPGQLLDAQELPLAGHHVWIERGSCLAPSPQEAAVTAAAEAAARGGEIEARDPA